MHFGNQYWNGLFRDLWWAQDGAPAHRLVQVRDRLNEVFGNNRVIGLQHNVEWPPRSPDLTPCDFFMFQNIAVLRQRIIDEVKALRQQPDVIRNAMRGMQRRSIICVARNGGHVEGQGT